MRLLTVRAREDSVEQHLIGDRIEITESIAAPMATVAQEVAFTTPQRRGAARTRGTSHARTFCARSAAATQAEGKNSATPQPHSSTSPLLRHPFGGIERGNWRLHLDTWCTRHRESADRSRWELPRLRAARGTRFAIQRLNDATGRHNEGASLRCYAQALLTSLATLHFNRPVAD